ncbi:hypothetical protein PVAP13_5NG359381 [Panicum virgatum]|uniref:Uncharacterized protein n=1 Tax=Panicum virgatum TaxID=38727 RepID=A0A8T0RWT5_PANVG|nr:hypothetical protein PVAP13_5NG359381 [Panicum virgatum]
MELSIRKSILKADLGLGDTSEVTSSPAPEPKHVAIMAPPLLLQAEIDPVLPLVKEALAQNAEEALAGGGNNEASGGDAQLHLLRLEIPSGTVQLYHCEVLEDAVNWRGTPAGGREGASS